MSQHRAAPVRKLSAGHRRNSAKPDCVHPVPANHRQCKSPQSLDDSPPAPVLFLLGFACVFSPTARLPRLSDGVNGRTNGLAMGSANTR